MRVLASILGLALLLGACSTYREHLNRGQRLYDENEFEHALAIWRDLERDMGALSVNDQARYAYLRGMTDYRLGFREDARHWLAIAKAIEQQHPGGLRSEWQDRIEESLTDLNRDVYGGGALPRAAPKAAAGDITSSDTGEPPGLPPMSLPTADAGTAP